MEISRILERGGYVITSQEQIDRWFVSKCVLLKGDIAEDNPPGVRRMLVRINPESRENANYGRMKREPDVDPKHLLVHGDFSISPLEDLLIFIWDPHDYVGRKTKGVSP